MHKKSLGRLAAVAAGTMVAGLVVPILGAASASAAEPTTLSVTPTSATVAPSGAQAFTVTTNGTSIANTIDYAITAGPDASSTPNAGTALTTQNATLGTATGNVTHGATAGTDTVTFFYDSNNDGIYETTEPHAIASLTANGAIAHVALTPHTASVATATNAAFSIAATDASGHPATGTVPVTVTEALPAATPAPLLRGSTPATTSATFPAGSTSSTETSATVGTTTTYTATLSVATGVDGAGTFDIASNGAGTVNITAGATSTTQSGDVGTLTVDPGNTSATPSTAQNDVAASLVLSPKTTTGIAGGSAITETATVKNTQGDLLGGVQVSASINGAAATTAVTDATGSATFSVPSSSTSPTSVSAYVEQDTHGASNAAGPNAGEPQDTATVTFNPLPAGATLTVSGPSPTGTSANPSVPSSSASEALTFHLVSTASPNGLAGQTINITTNTLAAGVTVTPVTGTTDANGNVVVTVAHTAGTTNSNIQVTGTLNGSTGAATTKTSTVSFTPATAATLTLSPASQTAAGHATVSFTATLVDQFGAGVAGATIAFSTQSGSRNLPANNTGASGTSVTNSAGVATFSYTDVGTVPVTAPVTDTVVATGGGHTSNTATVTYIPGTATASVVTLNPPTVAASTTADPVAPATAAVTPVTANVKDVNGVNLANQSVVFTNSGVGGFADANGNPISATTVTVPTDASGNAVAFIRSKVAGNSSVSAAVGSVTSTTTAVTYTNSQFTAVVPSRLVDTRSNQGGIAAVPGALAKDTIYNFNLNLTNAPEGATAYVFNVTAINPSGNGNLRIGPANIPGAPGTSIVNYQPGKTTANTVIVPNTDGDQFTLYSDGAPANVAIDLQGYYVGGATSISTTAPVRTVSTLTIPANVATKVKVAPAATPLPKAVAINVTAIVPSGIGNLSVYSGTTRPNTSNINYIPGVTKAGLVLVQPAADGTVTFFSSHSPVNIDVDLFATLPSTSATTLTSAVRALDTRVTGGVIVPGAPRTITVTGTGTGVPVDAQAVLVGLTAIHAVGGTGNGNLAIYPGAGSAPLVSNINYVSSTSDVANFAIVRLGPGGTLTLATQGSKINAAVDILGYVPAGS